MVWMAEPSLPLSLRTWLTSTVSTNLAPCSLTSYSNYANFLISIDGSALGIGVITSFICQQMNDKCHASATQIANCNAGATAAAALTGQAAADALYVTLISPLGMNLI
ncbi:hypothetical protein DL93DRAFT_163036 [Clavulina sp. PMI_390]|nr:hypothetical protein DL93DRAFT_163036 [Clavulina sp. PMI_390]